MASQDIQPEESISQIGFTESSTAGTSNATNTTPQLDFLSRFSSPTGLGNNFLLIENDPMTLARSKAILKVINL